MNSKLQEALDKAETIKKATEERKLAAWKAEADAHQEWLARYMPAARKWIEEKLYNLIAHEEATCPYPDKKVWLGSGHKDGVPVEAIYEAAKEVEGLIPTYDRGREIRYYIEWTSADPNLNRNDR